MLLVASPRYSLISRLPGPSPTMTTPRPARPGLPLHAPSVHTWIALAGAADGVALAADFAERPVPVVPAVPFAPGCGLGSAGGPGSVFSASPPGAGVGLGALGR